MDNCTTLGHLVGMLDRDQRTAKFFTFVRNVVFVKRYNNERVQTVITKRNEMISHRFVPGRTSPHSSCKTRKNGYFWKSLHRLKHALIIGAYLSVVTFPSILSAPTRIMSSKGRGEPKWKNPCGIRENNGVPSEYRMPDDQLIHQIIKQAEITQARATQFKEDYTRKTFKMDVEALHNYYKDKDYEWLPTKHIPKKLNHKVPIEHLRSLELKQTLLDVYVYLQKIAVGLEQIVWDEEERNGAFKSAFAESEDYLRTLLCEIHTAIIEKDLVLDEIVSRDVMADEFRNMSDDTSKNVRNWIIYRDYLNLLEYTIDVFRHLRANLDE